MTHSQKLVEAELDQAIKDTQCCRDACQGRGPDCPDHPRKKRSVLNDCLLAVAIGAAAFMLFASNMGVLHK